MEFLLWLAAVVIFFYGLYLLLVRKDVLWGIVAIVVSCLVGPMGYSLFY